MRLLRPLQRLLRDRAGRAVAYAFVLTSTAFASWIARIPELQTRLDLSEGVLGLALVGAPVGSIVAMMVVGRLVERLGAGRATFYTALAFCASAVGPALSTSAYTLFGFLALVGLTNGALNVSMNAAANAVEDRMDGPIMAACHGFFSLGGAIGAGAGSLAAALQIPFALHLLVTNAVLILGTLAFRRTLASIAPPDEAPTHAPGTRLAIPRGPLLGLAAVALLVLIGEGAMADWSAVYLRQVLGASAGLAGLGYAAFSIAMATGRFLGDGVAERLGNVGAVRYGALLAALGLTGALLVAHPLAALIGFACVGLGYAGVVPVLYRAAAQAPGTSPSVGIAAVASAGYVGFLGGPPLIGALAEVIGLSGALGLVALFAAGAALMAAPALHAATASRPSGQAMRESA